MKYWIVAASTPRTTETITAPQSKASSQLIGPPGLMTPGLRQPQHELPDCTGVALNEFVEVLGNGDAIDIAASLNF